VQETQKINIGTQDSPKYVNLDTNCTEKEVDQYTALLKEYYDVFAWTYDDLKESDKSIFQHIIPLRRNKSGQEKVEGCES
jgi:hypothetical protein